jgi:hypothetical protein
VLLSWSGSMFEYLMPTLVMPGFAGSLLDQTCSAAVARQIAWGAERGVPWGVSESAYNVVDMHLTYQYRAFGVPGLGLKRGLSEDLVVAPYASALALLVAPALAAQNLRRLSEEGAEGVFGLYEAIDYTEARLPRGQDRALIRSYMAHHQGMSLLAFAHVLLDRPMQRRFESDPQFQATMLLLQERVPRTAVQYLHATEIPDLHAGARQRRDQAARADRSGHGAAGGAAAVERPLPRDADQRGGGYSRWRDLAVTRWQEDGASDHRGSFLYLRDVEAASSGRTPTSRRCASRPATRRSSPTRAWSTAAASRTSRCTPRSSSRPRTTSSCGARPSATARACAARSR